MEYLIDHPSFERKYSKEEIQLLVNEKKINSTTKIWNEEWGEWRKIENTEFALNNFKNEVRSDLPDNFFLSAKNFLAFIDNGHIFRKPFSWLYSLLAILNLIFPIYILFKAIDNRIFDSPTKLIIVFLLVWVIIAFASWIGFQLWWDRKSKVVSTSSVGDEFVATPVFSHFIQTIGEWLGTWVGIVGFSVAVLTTLILGEESKYLSYQLGLSFMKTGFLFIVLMPIYGFLIIVATRFLAEQFRALSSIANNTKKN